MEFCLALLLALQDPPTPKPEVWTYRAARRLGSDEVPLDARLTTGKPPRLDVRGKLDLPAGTILAVRLTAVREVRKGNLLTEEAAGEVGGAFARVLDGGFEAKMAAPELPRLRLHLTVEPDHQSSAVLALLEGRPGPRRWELDLVLPAVSGTIDLGSELARLGDIQRRTRTLIVEADRLLDLPDRNTAQAELMKRLAELQRSLAASKLDHRYPVGSRKADAYLNSLRGNLPYLERRNGVLWFPPGPGPTTPEGAPFTFDALRQEFLDAEQLAAREFVLWVHKDAKLDGRRPAHDELLRKHADFPGVRELIDLPEEKVRALAP